ncbi:MAG: 2-oxo-hepta-3-ene-1,7-dioic acid hydratase, partial [Psychrosphaera sp.]|nr:2-oxo-hepta-3-ene-1,7-dioic acid hydratase [Psychrosphaera sp.]
MLSKEIINTVAQSLYTAERERVQIPAITLAHPQMSMDDAYLIQRAWVDKKIADGRKIKGYKIGLTSRAMQKSSNIDEPDYGILLDDMFFADGSEIEAAAFTDPRIEAELAFVLKDRLEGEDVTLVDVLNATDYVIPSLELIAARCHRADPKTGYTRKVYDTIADNAANAG